MQEQPSGPLSAVNTSFPSPPSIGSRLRARSDLHLERKIWHAAGVGAMTIGFNYLDYRALWLIWLAVSLVIIPVDLLRQKRPAFNRLALTVFSKVLRRHELNQISGFTYLLLGAAFLLLVRDRQIVTLTLLFLAFGDPIASYCGIRFGKDKIIGEKTLQGSVGAFVTCTVLAAVYFYAQNAMMERLWVVAPMAGLIGALAELIPIGKVDDNLSFPVVAAALLWLLFHFFSI